MKQFDLPGKTITMDGFGSSNAQRITKSTIDSGMIFLEGELEKIDPKLHEPLTAVTWARDIPVRTGGGFVESVANYAVDYATSGGNKNGIQGKETNDIPVMQADISRDSYRVFNWSHVLKVPFVERDMLKKIGRSLEDILNRGIRLAHDKMLDQNTYVGQEDFGTYGLVNSPLITATAASTGTGGGTEWEGKTPVEIMNDINQALTATWAASEYDITGMANHILIPPAQYAYIRNTPVTSEANKSIYNYLMENNIATSQGITFRIEPCRWCEGAGADGKDRMVMYANDVDRVRFDHTVTLHRVMTQPVATEMAYMSPYLSQFSEVQWVYTQHARYVDGI